MLRKKTVLSNMFTQTEIEEAKESLLYSYKTIKLFYGKTYGYLSSLDNFVDKRLLQGCKSKLGISIRKIEALLYRLGVIDSTEFQNKQEGKDIKNGMTITTYHYRIPNEDGYAHNITDVFKEMVDFQARLKVYMKKSDKQTSLYDGYSTSTSNFLSYLKRVAILL